MAEFLCFERAVDLVLDDVLEGSGDRVKGLLAIHFPACHAAFTA